MKKVYYITGVSGTGKTTLARELAKQGYKTIDQDKLCVWKNNQTLERERFYPGIGKEFLENHDWYCDISKLNSILEENHDRPVFVVGVSANQNEYLDTFTKIFLLKVRPEIFFERIDKREDNLFGKHQSEKDHIMSWYEDYEKEMIDKGAIEINGEVSVDQVIKQILDNL